MQDNMSTKTQRRPRVLFFGMQGDFSTCSLQALLHSDVDVCAVVVPASPIPGLKQPSIQRREPWHGKRPALPLASPHTSIIEMAGKQQIPVWEVCRLSDAITHSTLAVYQPDIICVVCFSQRIPRAIIDLPRLGCLNVHPSLLPANRGPVPLFWTFRNGEQVTGVTIHVMNETMDTGDILAQEKIEVRDGISYAQLEMHCAAKGGTLLAQVVHDLYEGCATYTPQDEARSSYYSFPTNKDCIVRVKEWNIRHIYNFINGVGYWNEPVEIHADSETFFTRECMSYRHSSAFDGSETIAASTSKEKDLSCRDGWVRVRLLER
ncbi:MAG: hypothetical protein NVSMB38_44060 [Ktedonobacteraceae bacterium]